MQKKPAIFLSTVIWGLSFPLLAGAAPESARPRSRTVVPKGHFDSRRVMVGSAGALRALTAGQKVGAKLGVKPLKRAAAADIKLGKQLHLLMSKDPGQYKRALLTPNHVALVKRSGVIQVFRRRDAETHISSGIKLAGERLRYGVRMGRGPIEAEVGPNGTVMLYRELPTAAKGEVASTDYNTSFALGEADAFHPFGQQGKVVQLALPKKMLDQAVEGKAGAVGWNDKGGGYNMGIDVETEVQIPSQSIRQVQP